jgi:hypothetical protein
VSAVFVRSSARVRVFPAVRFDQDDWSDTLASLEAQLSGDVPAQANSSTADN